MNLHLFDDLGWVIDEESWTIVKLKAPDAVIYWTHYLRHNLQQLIDSYP